MFDLIIAAGGSGSRANTQKNKLLTHIGEKTVVERSTMPFLNVGGLEKIIVAVAPDTKSEIENALTPLYENILFVTGGKTRAESVKQALAEASAEYVLIHDGARPFVTPEIIRNVLDGLNRCDCAVPVIAPTDSLADISDGYRPVNRADFAAVQTPQGFLTKSVKNAYSDGCFDNFTDDVSVYLTKYSDVVAVEGNVCNKKITVADDLLLPVCRAGTGFDTHLLTENRKLILGGVEIPHTKGLLGHSDADVLLHAVSDAILSAAGERDIGFFFPDTDDKYLNADSAELLEKVVAIAAEKGLTVHNVSATILAQKPKLSPYIDKMRKRIANILNIDISRVGICATTTEGVGAVGEEAAISVISYVTLI